MMWRLAVVSLLLLCVATLSSLSAQEEEVSIHTAVLQSDYDAVQRALNANADPNSYNLTGFAPLHSAARNGDLAIVTLLLERGADPDIVTRTAARDTALHIAARNGHVDIVRWLLRFDADRTLPDAFGNLPVYDARIADYQGIVRLLTTASVERDVLISLPITLLYHISLHNETPFAATRMSDINFSYLYARVAFRNSFLLSSLDNGGNLLFGYEIGVEVPLGTITLIGPIASDTLATDTLFSPFWQINAALRLFGQFRFAQTASNFIDDVLIHTELLFANSANLTSQFLVAVGAEVNFLLVESGRLTSHVSYVLPFAAQLFSVQDAFPTYWQNAIRVGVGYQIDF